MRSHSPIPARPRLLWFGSKGYIFTFDTSKVATPGTGFGLPKDWLFLEPRGLDWMAGYAPLVRAEKGLPA